MISVDDFMRGLSDMAEKTIEKHGSLTQSWIAYTASGEELLIATPVLDDRDRIEIPKDMRAFFEQRSVVRYGHICETWIGAGSGRPSQDPDRIEAVKIEIEDASSGEVMTGFRRIVRSSTRGKPSLAKLEIGSGTLPSGLLCPDFTVMPSDDLIAAFDNRRPGMYAGLRLLELGRRLGQGEPRIRITPDLPNPKTAPVFAAYNESHGIIGRRLNDELLIMTIAGHPWDPSEIPEDIEVLAVPEGERLIATVLAKLRDNAMPAEEPPRRPYFTLQSNDWLLRLPSSKQGGGWSDRL